MIPELLLEVGLGLAIGFCIGMTGVGGGVLVLPPLTLLLHFPPTLAVGTASLYALLTKLLAGYHHFRLKTIDWNLALWFMITAVPSDLATAFMVNWFRRQTEGTASYDTFQSTLKTIIAVVVFLCAISILLRLIRTRAKGADGDTAIAIAIKSNPTKRKVAALIAGLLIGILNGATSVVGVVIVPTLLLIFGLAPSITVGTSIIMALALSACASIMYGGGGQIDVAAAAVMAGGSLIGVPLGSRLSVKIKPRPFQWAIGALILVCSFLMLSKQSGAH